MKNKKKHKIILLILTIFVILYLILFSKMKFSFLQDDILFLKFIGNIFTSEKELERSQNISNNIKDKNEIVQYILDITYKGTNFTNVNLIDTIKQKTLVDEKIAPGVSGEFDIIIKTNKDTKYQIYLLSKNEKPENLKFNIANTNIYANKIEDLTQYLTGNLKKGETKTVTINWNWNYENEERGNVQDTEDSKNIDKYIFEIYTYGEELIL